jgi:hypothetical protein
MLPSTAKRLGTTVDSLYNMPSERQLDYVYKYFSKFKYIPNSSHEVHLTVFYPIAVNKPNSFVIADTTTRLGRKILKGNKPLDLNNDNILTKGEFVKWSSKAS